MVLLIVLDMHLFSSFRATRLDLVHMIHTANPTFGDRNPRFAQILLHYYFMAKRERFLIDYLDEEPTLPSDHLQVYLS